MRNLDKEYVSTSSIYEQQKEYRMTIEGKLALRRAKERQILKSLPTLYCKFCKNTEFEVLTLSNNITLCYNCKLRRPKVLQENELCR
jgi:hypothetical protein